MLIGKRIKTLRNQQNLSLRELSKKINISISFLSDIENSRSQPSLERLKEIAVGLNTSVSFLLGESFETANINSPILQDILHNPTLLDNKEYLQLLEMLLEYPNWSSEDRNELIIYLKAKQMVREYKG